MLNDEALLASRGANCTTLATLVRVLHRILVGAFGDGKTLQTDGEAGVVHHREHVAHAFVFFSDEPSDGSVVFAVRHHTRRRTVDTEFVLDRYTTHVISFTDRTIGIQKELWNKEH